ncbi:MAG TPA: roadblock/LC7 domain-containing protein [Actinomycetota bacterium]|nr:roadblock/LC7 domain-containing protein [Actinomycetota bacterium]
MTKADLLAQALDDFLATSPEVEAAAVVSADGLPMASALPPHVQEDRLAAMSAALLTLGERAAQNLGKGELAQVFVEGSEGHVILMSAGLSAVLVAVTSRDAKAGLILFEMRRAAGQVQRVMDAPVDAPVQSAPAAPSMTEEVALQQASVVRAPEPTPAAETESSSMSGWQ